jgi:hypothetical protein
LKYKISFSPFAKEDKKGIKTYLSKFYPRTNQQLFPTYKRQTVICWAIKAEMYAE